LEAAEMTAGLKDSPEIIEFRKLFARLKDWSEDDPAGLPEFARADEGIRELGTGVLRAAGSIQRSEKSERDLFTAPVDPRFISEWRDFEERFASVLLSIRSEVAAGDLLFSFDYYEEPDQWVVADFKALMAARSLDATIKFAVAHAERALKDAPGLTWLALNPKASTEGQRAFTEMAKAASKAEDAYHELRNELLGEIKLSPDESRRSELRDFLSRIDDERLSEDEMPIEHVAKDAWTFWKSLRDQSGLDLRGVLRRRALIPFVLFPRHVSARLKNTDLPSIYQNLRQAHDAFVFGIHFAALALMRSVMEMTVRDHYGATGKDLDELIDSVADRLPRRANAAALHRLRRLVNEVLHGKYNRTSDSAETEKRDFERETVALLFVLRALIEGVPQWRPR
jgi:hypothetical protein